MSSSTQYNSIGSRYNRLKALPFIGLEQENLRIAMEPILREIPKARVLDLACGTGNYTRDAVNWGAASSLGADISCAMIEGARQLNTDAQHETVKYVVADATRLDTLGADGTPKSGQDQEPEFDIIVAGWLLNYAEDDEKMLQMWTSITRNLKPGGYFVGVTHPLPDIDDWVRRIETVNSQHPGRLGVRLDVPKEKIANGVGYRMTFNVLRAEDGDEFAFDAFIQPQSLYEEGAKAAGMTGPFRVQDFVIPKEYRARESEDYWAVYDKYAPHFSVFTVQK